MRASQTKLFSFRHKQAPIIEHGLDEDTLANVDAERQTGRRVRALAAHRVPGSPLHCLNVHK